jgi:mono/diheme cytochrome c family protein
MKSARWIVVGVAVATVSALAGATPTAQSAPAATRRTLMDGVFTADQAARGRAVYERHCAECHMHDLAGREYAGALAGYGFQLKWQDATLGELLGRIRSMPLGRPRSLTGDEYIDILAYVLQKNAYPQGTSELTAEVVATWPPIKIERTIRSPERQ